MNEITMLLAADKFIRLALEEAGIPMVSAEVTMILQTYVEITEKKDIKNIQKTLSITKKSLPLYFEKLYSKKLTND